MDNLRKALLSLAIIVFTSNSWATLYESDFVTMGSNYLRSLGRLNTDRVDRLSASQKDQCLHRYNRILKDGVIDIRILLGYFDWTNGNQITKDGTNYGYSPSIDPGAYQALRRILTSRCPGDAEFCGFEAVPGNAYRFTKKVIVLGKPYQARIDMYYASVSEYLNANIGRYSSEQKTRSQTALAQFKSALQNADAVFYFGHSRNGGGPDFNPPLFIKGTNKVNYGGYYKPNRPGLKNLLSALQDSSRQPSILGMMSCDSRDHFLSSLRKVAPKTGVVSSLNVLQVDGVFTATIGAVDAILRGQCGPGFMASLRQTNFNEKNITMDGMFP